MLGPIGTLVAIVVASAAPDEAGQPAAGRQVDFAREVFPIFRTHCLGCHGPERQRGGLRLDSSATALKQRDAHAPAIVPGRAAESRLVRLTAGLDEDLVMPPRDDGRRTLTDAEITLLRTWIDQGAVWPDGSGTRVGDPTTHWALRPLRRPPVPAASDVDSGPIRNPVDAFLAVRLREKELAAVPEADRRTLIRRLSFDLVGLPPSPEEVAAFEGDPAPDAYDRLVDRLLGSPRFGERSARLWLDVAHFGESDGFGMDRPRKNAWPYRDYLIAAFNTDTPYARFVQEQLAADALFPGETAKIPALGFVAAGPFNQSALAEQVDGTECKMIAQNLDRDDMVSGVAATFLSLTVGCARCHDHKFDPIPQRDYYRLQAVFAGVGRAERRYDPDPVIAARRGALESLKGALDKDPDAPPSAPEDGRRLAQACERWEAEMLAGLRSWRILKPSAAKAAHGTTLALQPDGSYLASGPSPETETYRFSIADVPPGATALRLEVLAHGSLPAHGPGRAENGNLHLTEWKAFAIGSDGSTRPVALRDPSADFDQSGWEIAKAIDGNPLTGWGIDPAEGRSHAAVLELADAWRPAPGVALLLVLEQHHGRRHTIGRFRLSAAALPRPAGRYALPPALAVALLVPEERRTPEQATLIRRHHRRVDLDAQLTALPEPRRVFAIAADFPAYRNYKPPGEPYPIRVLKRGDIKQPLDAAGPGALSCVRALDPEFRLVDPRDEKTRRAALARWITYPENPLTWRSIANRIWRWHFGVGLVDTPNDFGGNGGRPSHPELLDWLAASLRDGGGSLKGLHRLIVTSAAYRRSSAGVLNPEDSDNRLLMRMNRLRLDAEQIRDALLVISGRLAPAMGGPSVMQFVYSDPNVEVSPRIDYSGFDPDSPASLRRGVYRFLFRNINDPLLEAFDAVDPSISTPRRNVTVTPQQALSLWNGRFVLRQCEHLVERLRREAPDLPSRLDRACRLAWGRPAEPGELDLLRRHAERHGLAGACRIVLNANDFLFVH
jgi:mono/diheme cytochrome c family protein